MKILWGTSSVLGTAFGTSIYYSTYKSEMHILNTRLDPFLGIFMKHPVTAGEVHGQLRVL